MTSHDRTPTFHTVSPLRVGARLAVLAAVCAALVTGFVAGLTSPPQAGTPQVAHTRTTCATLPC